MRLILLPFAWIFGLIITIRNFMYDKGWLRSFRFDFPIILVGNLSAGGTGKTPHVEYIIRLLSTRYKVATLSRGYKRTYKGFGVATDLSLVEDIGDEPKLYKQKYRDTIEVAVSEDRVGGVYQLLQDEPETQVIIMDDGFQHRRLVATCNIILTTWKNPFYKDHLLPAGNLRETKNGLKRAHAFIVTKCPDNLSAHEQQTLKQNIQRHLPAAIREKLPVFLTTYDYTALTPLFPDQTLQSVPVGTTPVLVTGIAGNRSLLKHVQRSYPNTRAMAFSDHHYFTPADIARIASQATDRCIITTEKDAMRLMEARHHLEQHGLSVFVQPIAVRFLHDAEAFEALILNHLKS